tara:strand:+ start:2289 stop:3227 length:939 start_codon:yes stop_codon:yes gene_type:complete
MSYLNKLNILKCHCENSDHLFINENKICCKKIGCFHNDIKNAYTVFNDVPILISNHYCDTAFDPNDIQSQVKRSKPNKFIEIVKKIFIKKQNYTINNANLFLKELKPQASVLIIGGGEKGMGTDDLYSSDKIKITSTDVYYTENVDFIVDAHFLPFKDNSFDGVWIQAVLEHVLDPNKVVSEINRVLKSNGIVYAETPFMQQVHEGAYDITRFTVVGHRYLFKNFSTIKIGGIDGVGTVMTWSIYYFFWSIFRSRALAKFFYLFFSLILNPFDKLADKKSLFDAGSGSYFLGRKSNKAISQKEAIKTYRGMQ